MRSSLIKQVKSRGNLVGTSKNLTLFQSGTLNKWRTFSRQILKRYNDCSVPMPHTSARGYDKLVVKWLYGTVPCSSYRFWPPVSHISLQILIEQILSWNECSYILTCSSLIFKIMKIWWERKICKKTGVQESCRPTLSRQSPNWLSQNV